MKVLKGLEELRERYAQPVLTIGNFDGVHKGHQALLAKVRERASAIGGTPMAMTFEPHPMRVLRPAVNLPLITPLEQKMDLLAAHGIEVTVCVRFDPHFAQLSADDFVDKLLVGRIKVAEVVVGYDFAFGNKGLGDLELLKQKGAAAGIMVHIVGPVLVDGRPISSTRVRQTVKNCDLAGAKQLLSRYYRIAGQVVAGHGRGGRLLGFPTANIKVSDELLPGNGVYAVWVELENGGLVKGVTNIGRNPTFDSGGLNVETHLLDFQKDLYGQPIKVHFVKFLRGEKRFSGPDELKAQIMQDVAQARDILADYVPD
jgi:riboflavin kinase/FMN adenylyltransferase